MSELYANLYFVFLVFGFFALGIFVLMVIDTVIYCIFNKSPLFALEKWLFRKFGE